MNRIYRMESVWLRPAGALHALHRSLLAPPSSSSGPSCQKFAGVTFVCRCAFALTKTAAQLRFQHERFRSSHAHNLAIGRWRCG